MVGLQKAGKNLFFRDFLHHLKHSRDKFIIAPGIKGLVMTVFTLPSYPYVFKVIRDKIAASKDTDRAKVKAKYWLVKHHDRVGRMTDILEYSDVAFPRERFSDELLAELPAVAPSVLEFERDHVVVRHLYIERRMIPLNLYLEHADDEQREHAMREYGDAIRELAAVNIFAGDLLFKNFGVTRFGRVVFYDYDEIEYLTVCNFRKIPAATARLGRDVGRRLVPGRSARRVPRGVRDVSPHRSPDARVLSALPRGAPRREVVAGEPGSASPRASPVEVLSYGDAVRFPEAPRGACYPEFEPSPEPIDAPRPPSRPLSCAASAAAFCGAAAGGVREPPSKEEQEAAKNTFACTSAGERIVIRFDAGEARLLMPDGNRVALYQIPAASGVRYSNGNVELRGKGMDLELVRLGVATALKDCQPTRPSSCAAERSGPV